MVQIYWKTQKFKFKAIETSAVKIPEPWTDREVMYVRYIGELFLRMLKALILPLIIPSLISAIGSLDMSLSGKVGGRAVGYYMATTVLAVILGIILVQAIHPGRQSENASDEIQGVRTCSIARWFQQSDQDQFMKCK